MRLRSGAPKWFSDDDPLAEAKCIKFPATKEYDPWYHESEDGEDDTLEAKKICKGTDDGRPCPLLQQCLEFALTNNERYGIWGGMSPEERAQLRKERRVWQQSHQDGPSLSVVG
jgi:WhiB family redox-sensing transcriptional regulator